MTATSITQRRCLPPQLTVNSDDQPHHHWLSAARTFPPSLTDHLWPTPLIPGWSASTGHLITLYASLQIFSDNLPLVTVKCPHSNSCHFRRFNHTSYITVHYTTLLMFWIYTKQVQTLPVCELHSHEMHTHFNFANIFMPHWVTLSFRLNQVLN